MDVLAGGDRGQRHLAMHDIGRGDRDDLDVRIGDKLRQSVGASLEAELLLRGLLRRFAIVVGDRSASTGRRLTGKDARNGAIGEGMGLAHEARADDADADVAHRLQTCQRRPAGRWPIPARQSASRKRLAAVMRRSPAWACRLRARRRRHRVPPIGVGIALQEEVQQRLADLGLRLAHSARERRRPQIVVQQHAGRAEDLEALVIAIDRLAAVVDMALPARGRAAGSPSACRSRRTCRWRDRPDSSPIADDLDRLLAQQPARHVEIMDHHVAEDAAGTGDVGRAAAGAGSRLVMMTWCTSPISPASMARLQSPRRSGSKRRLKATMTLAPSFSISADRGIGLG